MTRHEFISGLREALTGEIPPEQIEENIRFYHNYIDEELRKGRSEEDIFAELGDPRLIARTIMETWQSRDTSVGGGGMNDSAGYSDGYSDGYGNGSYSDYSGYGAGGTDPRGFDDSRSSGGIKWYHKAIPIVIIALILLFILWIVSGLLRFTFSILLSPVFWVIVLVLLAAGYFSQRR